MEDKKVAFEYLLLKLTNWYKEVSPSEQNDLSVLKVLKLLFFVSAVKTSKNSEDTLLDKVFNTFFAMPYGHVESEVYSIIKNQNLHNISINNYCSSILNDEIINNTVSNDIKNLIDKSINELKSIDKNFILLSSFDLVDLSHSWYSWQKYYNLAQSEGMSSKSIPVEEIKKEDKMYQI